MHSRLPRLRVALLMAVLLVGVGPAGCTRWIAEGIVKAPNQGREVAGVGAARSSERIDVGPPDASLAVTVVAPEPPAGDSDRGTVFVLHGIRDRKESMAGVADTLAQHG